MLTQFIELGSFDEQGRFCNHEKPINIKEMRDCPFRFERNDVVEIESTHDTVTEYRVASVDRRVTAFGGLLVRVFVHPTRLGL